MENWSTRGLRRKRRRPARIRRETMGRSFEGKNILLGVSGGIAAYKVVELARLLVKSGALVRVAMTESASRFVTPLTFRTVTGNPVATSLWSDPGSPVPHISLSEEADVIVVAPATANVIARIACGLADDLVTTTVLAARGTVLVAPAMNQWMYENPLTRRNLATLRENGIVVIEPGTGDLACGETGVGRMAEPERIVEAVTEEIVRSSGLEGRRMVVTAGPTREYIDPVRFISNPSTGLMGFNVARRAAGRGAEVTLVAGPTTLSDPPGVQTIRVTTAAEMKEKVIELSSNADVLVMSAAVADYRPVESSSSKLKKADGLPEIKLERTDDIVAEVVAKNSGCLVAGFAAETDNVIENALGKLRDKGLDFIVANRVGCQDSGFGVNTCEAAVLEKGGGEKAELSMMSKLEIADALLDRIAASLR